MTDNHTNGFYWIETARITPRIDTVHKKTRALKPEFDYWTSLGKLLSAWTNNQNQITAANQRRDALCKKLLKSFGELAMLHQYHYELNDAMVDNSDFRAREACINRAHTLAMRPGVVRPALRVLYWMQSKFSHR